MLFTIARQDKGFLVDKVNTSQQCTLVAKANVILGCVSRTGTRSAACETTSRVLGPVWGSPPQKRHRHRGASPGRDTKLVRRLERGMEGERMRDALAQPGEEKGIAIYN